MFCGSLNWADIQDFFRLGIGNAFRRYGEYPEDNKEDSENRDWSHILQAALGVPNGWLLIPAELQAESYRQQQRLNIRHGADVPLVGGRFFAGGLGSDHIVGDDQSARS